MLMRIVFTQAFKMDKEFYLRYYVGHKGQYGHESLEFEFGPDGLLKYSNVSNYRNEKNIFKQVFVYPIVLEELIKMVHDSQIMDESDKDWPAPDNEGTQELEIFLDQNHISFATTKVGTLQEIDASQ